MNRAECDATERELLEAKESLRKAQEGIETIRKGEKREDGKSKN